MTEEMITLEFFSGIGAFSHCLSSCRFDLRVAAAFDQSEHANATYEFNLGLKPISRNLDSIRFQDIAPAKVWWLSPPCTPFSRRGHQLDTADPRAAAFLNLMSLLPRFSPEVVLLENVGGFAESTGELLLYDTLAKAGYRYCRVSLCPSQFGIPSLRPRLFYVATLRDDVNLPSRTTLNRAGFEANQSPALSDYLDQEPVPETFLPENLRLRYERSLDIVEDPTDPNARAICFTSGYARTMRAGGSFLRMSGGSLRRFSPKEIVRLLGFPDSFAFPSHVNLNAQWRLAGNSVDLTCIRYLLSRL